MKVKITLFLLFILFSRLSFSQYQINGNASSLGGGCYQLTPNTSAQVGSVWNTSLIDLNNPFDFTFYVNLGCNDGGADGICFGLQPLSTNIGISGNGMGLGGVSPSLGVYIDTYQNTSPDNDPAPDHISINSNGDVNHLSANNLAGPVDASASSIDVEDCVNHTLRISWDPATQTMQVWFDGVIRLTYVGNIITSIFGGNPNVYWGFTGSTGALTNDQSFCIVFNANFTSTTVCEGSTTSFTDQSTTTSGQLITNWSWDFGDGTPVFSGSAAATYQNPTHTYLVAGNYTVQETITVTNLQTSTVFQTVTVLAPPIVAAIGGMTVCASTPVNLTGTVGGPSNAPLTIASSGTNNNIAIPDGGVSFGWTGTGGSAATSTIPVTGLNTGWTFGSVTFNITHTWDGDVIVYLFDPCGNNIQLTSALGGSGDNYTNTNFTPTASTTISSGVAPFNGTFVPSGGAAAWAAFIAASQGCGTANGNWQLLVGDDVSVDPGTLNAWSITFINPSTPTYVWAPTTNMTNSTSLTPTVSPTVNTTYTLTATNSYGCTDTAQTTVTIAPSLVISATPITICAGQTATLVATGGSTYTWSAGATVNPIHSDSATVSPLTTSTYTVTGTTGTCTGTGTVTVTVNSSLIINANSVSICPGQTANLSANGGPVGTTYLWSAGATPTAPNAPTATASPLNTTTYTVTGNSNGCTGSGTATVVVNPIPTVTVTSPSICASMSALITASGATSYTWSAGATSTGVNTATASPITTTSYTVTGTLLGCTNTATSTVTVGANVSITATNDTICSGDVAHLSASGATTYTWSAGASASGVNTAIASPTLNTTYTVTGTTGNCTGTALAKVVVHPTPVASFSAPLITSEITPLVNFTDYSSAATQWNWNFGDAYHPSTNTSTEQNPSHTYSAIGNYCITLVATNASCKDSTTACIDIAPEYTFYIPNAFSPNGDGRNDEFFGIGRHISSYQMTIYNRWGELIFYTDHMDIGWDGRRNGALVQEDVYVYMFTVMDNLNKEHKYIGNVSLVK